jgi:uncharacterized membrane protein YccC
MAVVGFATLFAGVINGYFAAAATGALLTFVLPVTLPAPNSAIPERLEGWGLAAGAGISALMLLWPPRRRADLQREAAGALRAVADHLDADSESWAERARVARASVDALGRRLLEAQHRPAGPTGPMTALASLPDELDWLLSFLTPAPEVQLELACAEDAEALAAAAQVLRASAERLQGLNGQPDFQRLETARDAVARALMQRLPELPADIPVGEVPRALDAPFRIHALTYAARQAAAYGLLASGAEVPELDHVDIAQPPAALPALDATERLAIEHASVRSVWFRNSLRGAVGPAVAVYIAQRTGLQHGFWVVLGTLSVLRSNALGTGWSIVSALAGTAVGIVLGALLVIGIGTHEAVLWGVLPVAVFLAAYAPRGDLVRRRPGGVHGHPLPALQHHPAGRLERWPGSGRGRRHRLRDQPPGRPPLLASRRRCASAGRARDAYAHGADYVVATARRLSEVGSDDAARAGRAADAALHRLDDAFRQYLAERSATAYNVEDVAALVSGAARIRRAALSLAALARMTDGKKRLEHCARNLDGELQALPAWYISFGSALIKRRQVPPPHIRDADGHSRLLTCVRDVARGRDKATVDAALVLLWSSQHLDNLWRLEAHLAERANATRTAATAAE